MVGDKMDCSYKIIIINMYTIEYSEDNLIVEVDLDDIREISPFAEICKCKNKFGEQVQLTKEKRLEIYKRVSMYLYKEAKQTIITSEFGEIIIS